MHRDATVIPCFLLATLLSFGLSDEAMSQESKMVRLKYNHPGLTVDLGAGLWATPLPMDVNNDGFVDMVVNEEDVPYNGVYVYENPGTRTKMPVFKPARRLSASQWIAQISYVDGEPRVLTQGKEYPDFPTSGFAKPVSLPLPADYDAAPHGDVWQYVDFDGDGKTDLVTSNLDWKYYGGLRPPMTYDASGRWYHGPLRGRIYVAKNIGTSEQPRYATPHQLIDVYGGILEAYGRPSPSIVDCDGDGDLDIVCGEILTGFTYFQNIGTRTEPKYTRGIRLKQEDGSPLEMEMQMIKPVAMDWDGDGDPDIICGEENGRVALIEHTGRLKSGVPVFRKPVYFQQEADELKCGALVTPFGVDWDADGDWDLICGNSAGYITFVENLSGPGVERPKWAAPVPLAAGGETIHIQAGGNGSIQGPCEPYFGYTVQTVCDWDGDGLLDIVANSIWGKVIWYKNIGSAKEPKLAAAQPIEVEWDGPQPPLAWGWLWPEGKQLLTQWRTSPVTADWNKDGLMDLVMLDQEGHLVLFERVKEDGILKLLAPKRAFFWSYGKPLDLTEGKKAGASGRRKLCVVDWDGDGKLDILLNARNTVWLQQTESRDGKWLFVNRGAIDPLKLAGHTTCPTTVDFDNNGIPDALVGAEDGHFYYLRNPRTETPQ